MNEQIVETWQINARINLYLLEAFEPENLRNALLSKGRSVGEQFAHINNVRLMWLKESAPELLEKCTKVEKEKSSDKDFLRECLGKSANAIAELFTDAVNRNARIKGSKPHTTAFLGYLTAHEAHHRSQIILAAKQAGHPLDKKILYGIWEWGVR